MTAAVRKALSENSAAIDPRSYLAWACRETSGRLGQGLSFGLGSVLAGRLAHRDFRVYVHDNGNSTEISVPFLCSALRPIFPLCFTTRIWQSLSSIPKPATSSFCLASR